MLRIKVRQSDKALCFFREAGAVKGDSAMRRRFKDDPKWITARYATKCAKAGCGGAIDAGKRGFHYSRDRSVYGRACGHAGQAACDFEAHRFDEGCYCFGNFGAQPI